MTYQIDIFTSLKERFPTWESLQSYLTSPDGGTIRCVAEGRYRILRYTKGISDLKSDHGKWMRSVIWDTETHLPVCIAPAKAEIGEPVSGGNGSYAAVEDFLDGIMINVFRNDEDLDTYQVATRTQLGANGTFYSEKTFNQMFHEALEAMRMTKEDLLRLIPQGTFASFLLQHPEHRVVSRCRSPHLWIIHTGSVAKDGRITINEENGSWPTHLKLPSHLVNSDCVNALQSTKGIAQYFQDVCQNQGWFYQGMVFKDGKGHRWRLRNPNYLYLRSLRGSESSDVERFLRLRSESKVTEYLKHYSEDRQIFWDLEQMLRAKTQEVFQAYCDVHKARTKTLKDLNKAIQPCVFKLHSHYLEHLRPNNETISMKHAVELVNNLQLYEQKRLLMPAAISGTPAGLVTAAAALAVAASSPLV
jgi:hypothetical protein